MKKRFLKKDIISDESNYDNVDKNNYNPEKISGDVNETSKITDTTNNLDINNTSSTTTQSNAGSSQLFSLLTSNSHRGDGVEDVVDIRSKQSTYIEININEPQIKNKRKQRAKSSSVVLDYEEIEVEELVETTPKKKREKRVPDLGTFYDIRWCHLPSNSCCFDI